MRATTCLLALLLPACAAPPEPLGRNLEALFAPGSMSSFGGNSAETTSVSWGDFDLDGDLDLVATNGFSSGAADVWVEWTAAGLTGSGVSLAGSASRSFNSAWGDTDGDSFPDLAIAMDSGIRFYSDASTFITQNPYQGNEVFDIEFGDCNGDGVLEIASTGGGQTRVDEIPGNASYLSFNHAGEGQSVAWGDMDDDGDLDLALQTDPSGAGGEVFLFENTSTGGACTLTEVTNPGLPTQNAEDTLWLNLSVGMPHLLVAVNGDVVPYQWTGSAMAVSGPTVNACPSGQIWDMTGADVDLDGDVDVIVACGTDNDVVLDNAGGSLAAGTMSPSSTPTSSVAAADTEGDGVFYLATGQGGAVNQLWSPGPAGFGAGEVDLTWGTTPIASLTWADQNDDGGLELIVAGTDGSIRVYNTPNGGLSSYELVTGSGGDAAFQMAVADFDSDGDQDLAVARAGSGGGGLEVYDGDITTAPFYFAVAGNPIASGEQRGVLVVDESCDGVLDLLTIPEATAPMFRLNQGTVGGWTSGTVFTGLGPQLAAASADLLGNGERELLMADPGAFSSWLAGCSGQYQANTWTSLGNAFLLTTGDFDGDDNMDIAARIGTSGPITIFQGGAGSPAAFTSVQSGVVAMTSGDVDGDGDDDIVAAFDTGEVRVYTSDGAALEILWESGPIGATGGSAGHTLALADVDGDGDLDLAAPVTNGVIVLPNYRNQSGHYPDDPSYVGRILVGDQFAGSESTVQAPVIDPDGDVSVELSLFDDESDPVNQLLWEMWRPGVGWTQTPATSASGPPFATSPGGTSHTFTWTPGVVVDESVRLSAIIEVQNPGSVGRSITRGLRGASTPRFAIDTTVIGDDDDSTGDDDDATGDDDDATEAIPGIGQNGDPTVDDDGDSFSEVDGDCDDYDPNTNPVAGGCRLCFQDLDADFHGSNVSVFALLSIDCYLQGHGPIPNDCDDTDPSIHGDAIEICDLIDQNCDGDLGFDSDGDGLPNCTGSGTSLLCGADADGDGVGIETEVFESFGGCPGGTAPFEPEPDCNDTNFFVSPMAPEICDGLDNDCDGTTEDEPANDFLIAVYYDNDADGYGTHQLAVECGSVASGTYALLPGDCDDDDPTINPGQVDEAEDGVDSDCDGTDSACYQDLDGDGWGGAAVPVAEEQCTGDTYVTVGGDCNDTESLQHPLADGEVLAVCVPDAQRDWNCDGVIDEGDEGTGVPTAWFVDKDGDGWPDLGGQFGVTADENGEFCDDPPEDSGMVGVPLPFDESQLDCEPARATAFPGAPELCNGLDDDCDGDAADGGPTDELCDGLDNDCDGLVDNGFDSDGDGFYACDANGPTDCDDANGTVFPGAVEVCGDGLDHDCDGAELAVGVDPDCWEGGCTSSCSMESRASGGELGLLALLGLVLGIRRRRSRVAGPALALVALLVVPGVATAQAKSPEQLKATADALRMEGKQREALLAYRAYIDAGGAPGPVLAPWRGLERRFGEVHVALSGTDPSWNAVATVSWEGGEVSGTGAAGSLLVLSAVPIGQPLRLQVRGSGLRAMSKDLLALTEGELPRLQSVELQWSGFGTLQVGVFDTDAATVSVHDGETWRSARPSASVAVTAGRVAVRVENAQGQTETLVDVPAQGSASFDPAAWVPIGLVLRDVPAGSRVSVFVEGQQSVIEAGLSPGGHVGAIDADSGLRLVPEVTLGSLVAGTGGVFLEHRRLGDGAWGLELTKAGSELVIDWASLPGSAAIQADYARWKAIHDRIERRGKGGLVAGVGLTTGGIVGAALLTGLAVRAGQQIEATRSEAQSVATGAADGQLQQLKDQHAALRTQEKALLGGAIGAAALSVIGAGITIVVPLETRARRKELGDWDPWPEIP